MSTTPGQEPSTPNTHDATPSESGSGFAPEPAQAASVSTQPTTPLSGVEPGPHHQPASEYTPGSAEGAPGFQGYSGVDGPAFGQTADQHASQTAYGARDRYAEAPQRSEYLGSAPEGPHTETHGSQAHPKSRSGMLITGLALGALLGGVVGGGVSAIVASNVSQPDAVVQGGGTLTLSNSETATAISGVAAVATPSVVTLEVMGANSSGSGSGVIYREDGYIITNAHVVTLDGAAGSDAGIRVKLSDGRILDGGLVGIDPYADLAVVKVDADSLPAVQIADSDKLNVGDLTVAIGAPLNLANTVTSGVVSAVDRGISVGSPLIPQDQSDDDGSRDDGNNEYGFPWDFRFGVPEQGEGEPQQTSGGTVTLPVIQTDASINPGNSGGALLNGNGELIGINVAIASPTSANGTAGSAGLGFAIPANLATRVADSLIEGEQPSHGLLGASIADSSKDTDEDANHAGGLIVELVRGGAADAAGLRTGDVITAIDGVPAADGISVSALIRMHAGGSEITIEYTRGGVPDETTVTLGQLEW